MKKIKTFKSSMYPLQSWTACLTLLNYFNFNCSLHKIVTFFFFFDFVCFVLLLPNSRSCGLLEKSLEQCLQCQDTMSLYRLALKMTLNSLCTDRERHIMREVT